MKIYHNPRCNTSRQTLAQIREAGIEPEIVEYLKTPPSAAELDRVLKLLDLQPQDILRKKEPLYKELGLGKKQLSRKEAIALESLDG